MKEVVIYNIPKDKIFLLTDEEFFEAAKQWANNSDYYCVRLEALIPPRHKWAETPKEDVGSEVFLLISKSGGTQKIFKKGDKFYQEIFDGDKNRKIEAYLTKEKKKMLISQDDYYRNKKYLK